MRWTGYYNGPGADLREDFLKAHRPGLELRYAYCLAGDEGPLTEHEATRGLHRSCELLWARALKSEATG